MKFLIVSMLTTLLFTSCGDSNKTLSVNTPPTNFSVQKYNENLIGIFYLSEMQTVLSNLEVIKEKTKECSQKTDLESLKPYWKKMVLSYQRLWPLQHSTTNRNLELGAEQAARYIGGSYPYNSCRVQLNTAEQFFLKKSLGQDPAFNSIEFLIFSDLKTKNFCSGTDAPIVKNWLENSSNLSGDICRHINFVSKTALSELKIIRDENKKLFDAGSSEKILSSDNVQKVYDGLSIFVDQVLKDEKTAQPLGLSKATCSFKDRTCPTAVEHRVSKISFEALSKNLEGVMAIFNQKTEMTETPLSRGLYQFLIANKQTALANKIYQNIVEAHKFTTSFHGQDFFRLASSLDSAEGKEKCRTTSVQEKEVPVCAMYKSIKSLSDKIKVDLRLALALSQTKQIEGDSD